MESLVTYLAVESLELGHYRPTVNLFLFYCLDNHFSSTGFIVDVQNCESNTELFHTLRIERGEKKNIEENIGRGCKLPKKSSSST